MAKNKKIIIWIVILLAVGGGGYYYFIKSKKPKIEYTTFAAIKGDLAQTVSVTGTINPARKYELAFQTTGKVLEMNVDVGDQITKNQRLAKIDDGTLLSELRRAEAEASVQKQVLNNMKRYERDFKTEEKNAQRARIRSAEAGADIIRDQIKDTVIYSPINGVVLKRFANVGDTTFVNAARSTSILTVAENGDLRIESNIPESDIAKIVLGQKAEVTFDSFTPDDIFEAQITEIDPDSTVIQDVVYYGIKLKMDNIDPRLKAGMSANVEIRTAEKENVLMIPLRAVQTEGNQKFVQILNPDGLTTSKIRIETGLEGDESMVEVKSGINVGQNVVTFTKNL